MEEFWIHKYEGGIENKKALLVFPHWNASLWLYKPLAKYFSDFHTVIYHCAGSLLSVDVKATLKSFALLEKTVLNDAANLKASGTNSFNMYGISLGTVTATRAADLLIGGRECVDSIILNLSCASFPFAVWNGAATRHIREELDAREATYEQLEEAWGFLSPINNLSNLKRKKILFFASLRDKILDRSNVKTLITTFHQNCPNAKIYTNRFLGHRSGGAKNLLRVRAIKDFLDS